VTDAKAAAKNYTFVIDPLRRVCWQPSPASSAFVFFPEIQIGYPE
jgi:hypothetical protein